MRRTLRSARLILALLALMAASPMLRAQPEAASPAPLARVINADGTIDREAARRAMERGGLDPRGWTLVADHDGKPHFIRGEGVAPDEAASALPEIGDDDNWDGEKLSYESAGETFVSGIWQGRDAAYAGSPIAIPSQFGKAIERKAQHFEILLGLLKLLLADVQSARASSDEWIGRAAWAVARGEAIIAGARDPDGQHGPAA